MHKADSVVLSCWHLGDTCYRSKTYPTPLRLLSIQSHPCLHLLPDFTPAHLALLAHKTEPRLLPVGPPSTGLQPLLQVGSGTRCQTEEAGQGCTPQQQAALAPASPGVE